MIRIQKSAIGAAPGVFDFLGGIASQAGGLALQSQTQSQTTVLATETSNETLSVTSSDFELGRFEIPIAAFKNLVEKPGSHEELANWIAASETPAWAANAIASLALFAIRFQWFPKSGISFAISTDILTAQAIGRSVSMQVATLRALEKLTGNYFIDQELALLSHKASEKILKHPCFTFIPAASAYGKPGCLSPLLDGGNNPHPPIELPRGVTIVGTPCQIAPQTIKAKRSLVLSAINIGKLFAKRATNQEFDYITTLPPSKYRQSIEEMLPKTIDGKSVLAEFTPAELSAIEIGEDIQYPVEEAFGYAIAENYRCSLASHLLTNLAHNSKRRAVTHLGEVVLQSHASYSRLGLSNSKVDTLIKEIQENGAAQGIFGGRITGICDSSNLVFLIDKKAIKRLRDLVRKTFGDEQKLTL